MATTKAFVDMTVAEKWTARVRLLEERGLLIEEVVTAGSMAPERIVFIDADGRGRWMQTFQMFAFGEGEVPG